MPDMLKAALLFAGGAAPLARLRAWRRHRRIRAGLRNAIGRQIEKITVLPGVDSVMRVETPASTVAVRPLRGSDDAERALQIAGLLSRLGIPHPEILHLDRSDAVFRYGFIIQEWIHGVSGDAAVESGIATERELFHRAGEILRALHSEPVVSYGPSFWLAPRDGCEYAALQELSARLQRLRSRPGLPMHVLEQAVELATYLRSQTANDARPVLVHGDLHACNLVVDGDELIFIDWVNAHGGCWVEDFARTRWIQSASARDALIEGFGGLARTDTQFRLLEGYYSIRTQLGLVEYYSDIGQGNYLSDILVAVQEEVAKWRAEIVC